MRNDILKRICCLFVPPIYSLLCKGCKNEDCRYALLLLAMEVISFILDLLGGSHWGYLLASFLLSILVLETTINANFIKRSRIKSEAQQLVAVEIVFSVLQLIISYYCLIRTLSGVKTNYTSSVFPLAYAIISVMFTFKSKKDVSESSSDRPPDTVKDTGESELENIIVDPSDTPVDKVGPSDPNIVFATSDANVPQSSTLRQRKMQSEGKIITIPKKRGQIEGKILNEIKEAILQSPMATMKKRQNDDDLKDIVDGNEKMMDDDKASTAIELLCKYHHHASIILP